MDSFSFNVSGLADWSMLNPSVRLTGRLMGLVFTMSKGLDEVAMAMVLSSSTPSTRGIRSKGLAVLCAGSFWKKQSKSKEPRMYFMLKCFAMQCLIGRKISFPCPIFINRTF